MKEEIEISSVFCPPNLRGHGRASAAVTELCEELTKRLKRPIYLQPYPFDSDMSRSKLISWYLNLGFIKYNDKLYWKGKE